MCRQRKKRLHNNSLLDIITGHIVFPGYIGTIYQAHNAVYLGRSTARTHDMLPDGTILSPRMLQKIRGQEQGMRYAVQFLESWGATPYYAGTDTRLWLREALRSVATSLRHSGNHRYGWVFDRKARKQLAHAACYPKQGDSATDSTSIVYTSLFADVVLDLIDLTA